MKSQKNYRVKVKAGDAEIQVEGGESGVVKIVEALADVLRGARKPSVSAGSAIETAVTGPATRSGQTDIRSFFGEKKPSSDIEAAATAAYYYQYLATGRQQRDTIDAASLQEAFRMVRRPLPARTIYTLTNARSAGYLDSAGEGEFRLNPVGYNLVEHGLGSSTEEPKQKKSIKKRRRQRRKKNNS